jgi:glycyl-tRNA synthetase beta chain
LAKCDLTSELVGEFPELQGTAGTYYARLEGLPSEVADAIAEQYLPRFSGDVLPQTQTGTALALADRLDTLVGIFGIGQAPTGSKDPFSLRRAAIGVLRLLIEKELDLPLVELTKIASENYHGKLREPVKAQHEALNFIEARYRAMYEDQGVAIDVIQSVQALSPKSPLDFDHRVKAVNHFKTLPEAQALAAANKRVANILAKEGQIVGDVDTSLLVEDAEKALFAALQNVTPVVQPLLEAHNYTDALSQLASLREPIDAFFDNVMVMAEDPKLKANRLRLLAQLRGLFTAIADVSMLQG